MSCSPEVIQDVALFSLLDKEELAVLASQVELCKFAPRQRIYKIGEPSNHAYILVSGAVQITTIDKDNQVVLLDEPIKGDVFGFASMLAQTPTRPRPRWLRSPSASNWSSTTSPCCCVTSRRPVWIS